MNYEETISVQLHVEVDREDRENREDREFHVDAGKIFEKIDNKLSSPEALGIQYKDEEKEGGRWLSLISEKYLISAYYHPTKRHSASVTNGFIKTNKSRVSKREGEWAIAFLPTTLFFNRPFYSVLDEGEE